MLAGTHYELADHKARVFPSSASATSEVGREQHLPNCTQEVGRLPSDDADGHARRTGIDIRVRCDACGRAVVSSVSCIVARPSLVPWEVREAVCGDEDWTP